MTRLLNKAILVTGGTTGIGLATARQLKAEGARVAITGSDEGRLAQAAGDLGDVVTILADAGDVAGQQGVVDRLSETFGSLDAVFINAGIGDFRPIEAFDEASFDRAFAINVKGPYFLIQALLPLLNQPASIVFNGSINAHIGMPNSSVYAATKAALISLARTLSGELIGRGIRANVVSPGPVATPLYGKLGLSDEQAQGMQEAILGQLPVGRFGDPDEIAQAVVYFVSDESRFTVGSELIIDGGMSTL